ncbi:MAG: toll/interleukin-1 receptor domain-containing protein [Methylococcales bacterium]|nr:toll/interleukin-1 receptor domain-containing protein [Methylococcales bacterium]
MVEKNTERLWEQLLDFIEDGRVIPVIGPELLMLDIDSKTTLLYSYLAEQLAKRLQISSEPSDTLNAIACRYLSQNGQREDIYPELKRAMPPLSAIKLPETLIKLAEIRPLVLFVTTSFDPLLAHVLNQVRYGGLDKTQVLAFSPGSTNDLPVALEQLDRATVFHLFGKLTAVPEYAVTDEDVLEFMHALQSRTSRPERLFDALIKQNLMVVGCPLSDWLGRFFVRIGKKERLVISSGKTDFLVGDQLQNETNLAEFLQHFSSRTKVFPMASIEFVNELHRRWIESHPSKPQSAKKTDLPDNDADKMQSGAVFLSYASEDRPSVISIRDALEQAGIDVWFDRNPEALRVGENFESKIKTNIDQCSLFVPIISRNTLTPKPRFFRTEWNHAQQLALRYPDSMRFIIPVAIDDILPDASAVPEQFRKLHWERMTGGQASAEFVVEIKRLYREYQKNLAQPA